MLYTVQHIRIVNAWTIDIRAEIAVIGEEKMKRQIIPSRPKTMYPECGIPCYSRAVTTQSILWNGSPSMDINIKPLIHEGWLCWTAVWKLQADGGLAPRCFSRLFNNYWLFLRWLSSGFIWLFTFMCCVLFLLVFRASLAWSGHSKSRICHVGCTCGCLYHLEFANRTALFNWHRGSSTFWWCFYVR